MLPMFISGFNKIPCILVDDELSCLHLMEMIIIRSELPLQLIGKYTLAEEGLHAIETLKPELVFLDIVMPDLSGIELVRATNYQDYSVIFTSAYPEYGLEAAKLNSFDYLLKPIVEGELVSAVGRFIKRRERQDLLTARRILEIWRNDQPKRWNRIALPIAGGIVYEEESSIEYFESEGNLTRICFNNRTKKIVNCNLKTVEEKVGSTNFLRTHKSFIINMDHIHSLSRKDGGYLEMYSGAQIPISRTNREDIIASIHNYLGSS